MWFGSRDWRKTPVVLISDAGLKIALGLSATDRLFSAEALSASTGFQEIHARIGSKRGRGEDLNAVEKEAESVLSRLHLLSQITSGEAFTIVPDPRTAKASWVGLPRASEVHGEQVGRELENLVKKVSTAYSTGDAAGFVSGAEALSTRLAQLAPVLYPASAAISREVHYNHLHPFRWAWVLYLAAFIVLLSGNLVASAWKNLSGTRASRRVPPHPNPPPPGEGNERVALEPPRNTRRSRRLAPILPLSEGEGRGEGEGNVVIPPSSVTYFAGLGLFAVGLAMQVYGFVLRTWIAGRAPVTNMYESMVWVSLGVAALAFAFELIYRSKVYALTAAPLAVLGLIFADMFPSVFNANIGPLPPVLRDNFWLVTHVLTITLGYAALALAMGLGHVILSLYLFKPGSLDEKSQIHRLLYRALQIGIFLLAIGTILGGVWANYSWGRFWGWDPKETWALIALLLYIFALHGRLAGWWGNFGLSVAASVCFNGVLMAWYGVNFVLGKGLHSYGFGGGGVEWVGALVALDLLFIGYCVAVRLRKGTAGRERPSPAAIRLEPLKQSSTGIAPRNEGTLARNV
ncbi:MAG: cytochrome c biogenesis protein CcsA [Verrucomicrobia bacterium]|nr:cytochrome c biogenesis protein CcsA [Verrucomicrobiota bacterium]